MCIQQSNQTQRKYSKKEELKPETWRASNKVKVVDNINLTKIVSMEDENFKIIP